jgi:hypothetical protein
MGAARRFDHDEARALHAAGETVSQLAARYGVSYHAMRLVVNDAALKVWKTYHAAWQRSGVCHDCGGACTREAHPSQGAHGVPLCISCAGKRRRTRFTDVEGVTHAKCFSCGVAKPLDQFPGGTSYRDVRTNGIHNACRDCNTALKRAWRDANRERVRAYNRERRRRIRKPDAPPSEAMTPLETIARTVAGQRKESAWRR